jgi:hypothetical protein
MDKASLPHCRLHASQARQAGRRGWWREAFTVLVFVDEIPQKTLSGVRRALSAGVEITLFLSAARSSKESSEEFIGQLGA